MLLIAHPHHNFWFHADTGIAWLRDEESSDAAVLFHCLTPAALAAVTGPELERIHLEVAAAYNNYGADEDEKDLPALPVSFLDRPDATPPADLPEWFLAIEPVEDARGVWTIHTRPPVFAALITDMGTQQIIHPGPRPNQSELMAALRFMRETLRPHQPAR